MLQDCFFNIIIKVIRLFNASIGGFKTSKRWLQKHLTLTNKTIRIMEQEAYFQNGEYISDFI